LFNDWVKPSHHSTHLSDIQPFEMPSQFLNSVMEESYNFLHNLVKLSKCAKRKQTSAFVPAKLLATARKPKDKKYDSDDMASTEPGDTSNNEFSDKSCETDGSGRSSGYSGTRAPKTAYKRLANTPLRPPPGLRAPPGLELPAEPSWKLPAICLDTAIPPVGMAGRSASSLNPNSPCFVPRLGAMASTMDQCLSEGYSQELPHKSQQLRQSIKMLKGALQEWEASVSEPSPPAPQPHVATPHVAGNNLAVLQDALTKLTPQQASMMKSFLDKKVTSDNPETSTYNAFPRCVPMASLAQAACRHPGGMQDSSQACDRFNEYQANQARIPRRAAPKSTPAPGFEESLKDHLRDLAELDSARVLMVRRINRLGMDSPLLLKAYFARFGDVDRVMVAHTRTKAKGLEKARVRPAPLGFVVMGTPEQAKAALAQGEMHSVKGVDIGAYSFESHSID